MSLASLSATEINAAYSLTDSNGDSESLSFSAASIDYRQGNEHESAVIVSLSFSSQTSPQSKQSDGQDALLKLKQAAADAAAYPKSAAIQKLDLAVKQLQIIRLLAGPNAAKELVGIAQQIRDASQDYAGAEQDLAALNPAADADASSTDQTAAAEPATASTPDATLSAVPGANTPDQSTGDETSPAQQQDPFYTVAEAALAEIKKALKKVLPSLLSSPDLHTRRFAQELRKEFNQAVNDTLTASENYSAAEPLALGTEEAAGLSDEASDSFATSASPESVAPSLNLVV